MRTVRLSALALMLLSACEGNPFTDDGGGGGPGPDPDDSTTVPAEIAGEMAAVSFEGGVLQINMLGISSSGDFATFDRVEALDIVNVTGGPDYDAYVFQETDLTRSYLAYVATNARGNLLAVSAADGGQFNEHNGGGSYLRLTSYTAPTIGDGVEQGQFSYAGTYAGIMVPGDYADGSAPRPPDLRPVEPWIVTGTIQINGSFADNVVEGGVVERAVFDQDGFQIISITYDDGDPDTVDEVIDLENPTSLVLRETSIDANGEFLGNVEFAGDPGKDIGDFGGAFGGLEASDVAGVLWLNPIDGQPGIFEYGTFNLPRCDLAGASPLCIPR